MEKKNICLGSKVRVLYDDPDRYKKYDLRGRVGIVESTIYTRIGIRINGLINPSSRTGLFWIKPTDLEYAEGNTIEYSMNEPEEECVMSKLKGFKSVVSVLLGGKSYYYALYEDGKEYNEGDFVMVTGAVTIPVKIDKIMDLEAYQNLHYNPCKSITAEVICKLDTSAYDERVANRKRAAELQVAMDKKIKEMDEVNKYEMYAKNCPELAQMLEEFKKLGI